ncbi:MAG: tRNA 2-thiouridine(34) synthase MnmA [bacterium]
MIFNEKKVLVGMSGGVDSSVAAGLLLKQGYEVIGVTIEPFYFYDYYKNNEKQNPKGSINDAKTTCSRLGIEHFVVDYFDFFKSTVVDYFIEEYLSGRTPNPCAKCNPLIKWGKLLQTADEFGAKYIATGHYAKIDFDTIQNRFLLKKGKDSFKDQSYFLWGLTQEQLSRTLFPLSDLTKDETRNIAKSMGFKNFNKTDSQEVCFIADNNYHKFLRCSIPDVDKKIGQGNILFRGKVLGKHQGYPFYTIGQRKGIGITYKDALYVKKINPADNTIEVDIEGNLFSKSLILNSVNVIKYSKFDEDKIYNVKIRYKDPGSPAKCKIIDNHKLLIEFFDEKRAVTPGQSAVLFEGDDLVAGGVIDN